MKYLFILILSILQLQSCNTINNRTRDSEVKYLECYSIKSCVTIIAEEIRKSRISIDKQSMLTTTVKIKLNKNYEIISLVIKKSSGSDEFDKSILTAITTTAPFDMLNGLSKRDKTEFREFQFKFGR